MAVFNTCSWESFESLAAILKCLLVSSGQHCIVWSQLKSICEAAAAFKTSNILEAGRFKLMHSRGIVWKNSLARATNWLDAA